MPFEAGALEILDRGRPAGGWIDEGELLGKWVPEGIQTAEMLPVGQEAETGVVLGLLEVDATLTIAGLSGRFGLVERSSWRVDRPDRRALPASAGSA